MIILMLILKVIQNKNNKLSKKFKSNIMILYR